MFTLEFNYWYKKLAWLISPFSFSFYFILFYFKLWNYSFSISIY